MSWIQKLYETYNACTGNENIADIEELCPVGYSVQNAHIEIVIDQDGNFRRASLVDKKDAKTLIPVTEKSLTGRTSGIAPHPLCDSLQYCAADYKKHGGLRESYFDQCEFTKKDFQPNTEESFSPLKLVNQILKDKGMAETKMDVDGSIKWLNNWLKESNSNTTADKNDRIHENRKFLENNYPSLCPKNTTSYLLQLGRLAESKNSHPSVRAVFQYVKGKRLVADLIANKILAAKNNQLLVERKDSPEKLSDRYPIMKLLQYDDRDKLKDQAKVFVRWKVESRGSLCSETWKDQTLFENWAEYVGSLDSAKGFCYVTGEKEIDIAQKHPAKIRSGKDAAKLISSNDTSGFTFLGRFKSVNEAASISSVVTQKAHSALRWLIGRKQAFRSGNQVFVSWAATGKPIPNPCANSWDFLGDEFQMTDASASQIGDVGQFFASRFNKKLAGYKANINDTEDIVVMGLDSASPGRMAITFYRELTGSEFLERIERWHSDFVWLQNYGKRKDKDKNKEIRVFFEGAPAPKDVAWCAYGSKVEGKNGIKLLNATVERLLPSIIDGRPVPRDLVEQCVRRVSNRAGLEPWEFEKCLGIACSLFRGFYKDRRYSMALEEERNSRDYLYGRLLAVAEKIESMALYFADEKRETTAARMMQRFADRPYSTWRTIETSLAPYKSRINAKRHSLLNGYIELIDEIACKFETDQFKQDSRLEGEFLLAYHCQRKWLNEHKREKGQWVMKSDDDIENQETDLDK
jgi:CRISPR-associated protein Csd1